MDTFTGDELPGFLYTMLAAVFGVLLIACANVANLLLVRTVQRTKEVAIRTALGSSRAHTIGQVLGEAFVLSVIGAGLGLGGPPSVSHTSMPHSPPLTCPYG